MSTNVFDLPQAGDFTGAEEHAQTRESAHEGGAGEAVRVVTAHRDPNDVRLLLSMASSGALLALLLLVSVACNIWMYYRRPDRIVVDRTSAGDRVVMVGDRATTGEVSVGPDRPGNGDKRTIATKWSEARYAIDPLTRGKDIERLFRMMEPRAAKALSDLMKKNGELERERAENWQAVWKPQSVTIDGDDPYKVNVIGTQEVTKQVGGVSQREARQLIFKLKLMVDKEQRRADRNQNTGFLVVDILDYQEIAESPSSPASGLAAQSLP